MNYTIDAAFGSDDQENTFGNVRRLALVNLKSISEITSADKAKIDTLVMKDTQKFHEVTFIPETCTYNDEYATEGTTDQFWNHTVNFSVRGHDAVSIATGRKIALGRNMVALAQRTSGEWFLLGSSNGMNTTVYTANAVAGANGRIFTLGGKNGTNAQLVDATLAESLIA
jgi:hypothetical protein